MPTSLPMPTKAVGDIFTTTLWNNYLRDNMNKLLNSGHRCLTVAQFGALTSPEGTAGTVAPDEVYLIADATAGVLWHLAYESGETTYKWRFLGGPPLVSEVVTQESMTSTSYVALATAGPSIALSRAGDYDVTISNNGGNFTNSGQGLFMSYDIGGTGAVDTDAIQISANGVSALLGQYMRTRRKTALGVSTTLTAKYRSDNVASATTGKRSMAVTPVRLV